MADRFPSLDDFDSGRQTEMNAEVEGTGDDQDFLARERAALGDDAAQFASANDNAATVEDGDDDLLGGGGDYNGNNAQLGGEEMSGFESSFPAVDSANEIAPGGTITGSSLPYQPSAPTQSIYNSEPEPEVLREWRERRDLQLQHRDQVSREKEETTRKEAQSAVDDFYENYNNKKDKTIAATRKEAEEFLASRDDTIAGGTSWDRIGKLVDLSGKGTKGGASGGEKARFRELLVSLRKDEKAPGATGY